MPRPYGIGVSGAKGHSDRVGGTAHDICPLPNRDVPTEHGYHRWDVHLPMRRSSNRSVVLGLVLAAAVSACSATANVSRAELAAVVQHDGIAFVGGSIPDAVVQRLASHRVVILGETHHLREHWEFVATLVRTLHAHGFRQLLVEAPQMADWLFDDYVTGGELEPNLVLPSFWLRKFEAIRRFNDTLPVGERVHVRAIDMNETWYGGAGAFRDQVARLSSHLPDPGPIAGFLAAGYATAEAQEEAIDALRAALQEREASLVDAWGPRLYATVSEMASVERASIEIRLKRETDDDAAAKDREGVIKQLADARIGESTGGTLVNIGGHHAQKSELMGTDQEWLGDYLSHRSDVTRGSAAAIVFSAARTELDDGASGTPWNILESASPDNELYRVMAETWPEQNVFLWLDDPLFMNGRIAMNSEDTIYATAFKEQYDAVVQYGLAHRMPAS